MNEPASVHSHCSKHPVILDEYHLVEEVAHRACVIGHDVQKLADAGLPLSGGHVQITVFLIDIINLCICEFPHDAVAAKAQKIAGQRLRPGIDDCPLFDGPAHHRRQNLERTLLETARFPYRQRTVEINIRPCPVFADNVEPFIAPHVGRPTRRNRFRFKSRFDKHFPRRDQKRSAGGARSGARIGHEPAIGHPSRPVDELGECRRGFRRLHAIALGAGVALDQN